MNKKNLLIIVFSIFGSVNVGLICYRQTKNNLNNIQRTVNNQEKDKNLAKKEIMNLEKVEEDQYVPVFDNNIVYFFVVLISLFVVSYSTSKSFLVNTLSFFFLFLFIFAKILIGLISFGIKNKKSFSDIFWNCHYPCSRFISTFLVTIGAFILQRLVRLVLLPFFVR